MHNKVFGEPDYWDCHVGFPNSTQGSKWTVIPYMYTHAHTVCCDAFESLLTVNLHPVTSVRTDQEKKQS